MNFVMFADASQRHEWAERGCYYHKDWMICCVEESGRKFFATTDPHPIGWTLRQEFGSVADAMHHIDEREIDKMLYRISGSTHRE